MYISAAPTTVADDFWPTIATIVPVLALALIVEARTTIAHWDSDFPWPVRSLQGLSWANVLIQFAIIEVVAINNLAANNEKSTAWVGLTKTAIFVSMLTLIFTPALSIFGRANAGAAIRLLFRILTIRIVWRGYRMRYRLWRIGIYLAKSKEEVEATLARTNALKLKALEDDGSSNSSEYNSKIVEVNDIESDAKRKLEEIEGKITEFKEAQLEMRSTWKEFREGSKNSSGNWRQS
ncbi:MAG TPA: hypothetical protein VHZ33_07130 [Trebonia sp.]|jgi:hypothetical protein|nr:hypothetical protein [Trebonia sp.]